jgi:hypothetical protein
MIQHLDHHGYGSSPVRELKGVWQKVQKDLEEPSRVSMDGLDEAEVYFLINLSLQVYFPFAGAESKHLECLVNNIG